MNDFSIGFGVRLKEERERKGLNQADFGALGGVGKLAQLNYEKGERSPSVEYLNSIGSHGVDVGYLLTGNKGKLVAEAQEPLVDCALLEAVLQALSSIAVKHGVNLEPSDSARLVALVYGRISFHPDRNDPDTIYDMTEMAIELWSFSKIAK